MSRHFEYQRVAEIFLRLQPVRDHYNRVRYIRNHEIEPVKVNFLNDDISYVYFEITPQMILYLFSTWKIIEPLDNF